MSDDENASIDEEMHSCLPLDVLRPPYRDVIGVASITEERKCIGSLSDSNKLTCTVSCTSKTHFSRRSGSLTPNTVTRCAAISPTRSMDLVMFKSVMVNYSRWSLDMTDVPRTLSFKFFDIPRLVLDLLSCSRRALWKTLT